MTDVAARTPMPPSGISSGGSRRSSQRRSGGSGSVTAASASAAAAVSVSPVAAPSVQAAQAHADKRRSDGGGGNVVQDSLAMGEQRDLPSGAFLTEAVWAGHDDPQTQSRTTQKQSAPEAKREDDDDEEDEMDAFQRRKQAQATGAEEQKEAPAEEEEEAPSSKPTAAAEEEEKSALPPSSPAAQSQALVLVRRRPGSSSTVAKSPGAAGPRKHLFPYAALFGSSRTKLAAARTARLAAIENSYERAMAERDLEARHAALTAQLAAEEAQRERDTRAALLAQQRRHAKLHAAKLRLEAQARGAEASSTLRERQALVAERRRLEREHERAATTLALRRLGELRTRALVDSHRTIDARWADEAAEAVARFEADKEARVAGARSAKTAGGATASAWKKKVLQLGLKDPLVVQQALGSAAALVPHPPANGAAATVAVPAAETAAAATDSQGQQSSRGRPHARRLPPMPPTGGGGGGGGLMHPPQLPTHGKGAPRRANPINNFAGGATHAISFDEALFVSASASASRAGSPSRAKGSVSPTPTSGRSVGATSRSAHMLSAGLDGGAAQQRSPSSRYTLPRKHASNASAHGAFPDRLVAGGAEPGPVGAASLETSTLPAPGVAPLFSFWCSALECAAALEPAGMPAAAAAPPDQATARVVEEIAAQFRNLFLPQQPSPLELVTAGSAAVAARAAGTPGATAVATRCTLDDLLRGGPPLPKAQLAALPHGSALTSS